MSWFDLSVSRKGRYPFVKVDLTKTRDWVPLICLSDLHAGAKNFRRKEAMSARQLCIDLDALVILGGDLIENANKGSIGAGCYEQTMTPDQQCDWIEEYLSPIKDRIIGAVSGNHEWRTYKDDGHKATKSYLKGLGLTGPSAKADIYTGMEFWGAIGCHKKTWSRAYTIYGCHSLTTNKTGDLEMNAMVRDWNFILADLLMKGHGHNMKHSEKIIYNPNASNAGVSELNQMYITTGNWIGREDSYAAAKPLSPKPVGTVMAWLKMNGGNKKIVPEYLYDGARAELPMAA